MGYEERVYIISVDLGQINDFTAITVFERIARPPEGYTEWYDRDLIKEHHLRYIERPERGTSYPAIIRRISELCGSPELHKKEKTVVIDITGVGRPVWDHMHENGFGRREVYGIQIVGGNTVTRDYMIYNVPKRDLVSALQVAFQNKDLKIAKGIPYADTLIKELINFKVKISLSGHDQYGAASDWREGVHDDIVLSAAMGVWLGNTAHLRTWREYNDYSLYKMFTEE